MIDKKILFKTNGIYAQKVNPEIELENHKSNALDRIWKAASNQKDEPYYRIVQFIKEISFKDEKNLTISYSVRHVVMTGEILDLADWHGKRSVSGEYKNLRINDNSVFFGNGRTACKGNLEEDFLHLIIINEIETKRFQYKLRFIPWIR